MERQPKLEFRQKAVMRKEMKEDDTSPPMASATPEAPKQVDTTAATTVEATKTTTQA